MGKTFVTDDDTRLALVILVDRRGFFLLLRQGDDEPLYPSRWMLPGSIVGEGENPEAAARRGVREETGIALTEPLEFVARQAGPRALPARGRVERTVYAAPCAAVVGDVRSAAGEAAFVAPAAALTMDLTPAVREIIAAFIASERYAGIVATQVTN